MGKQSVGVIGAGLTGLTAAKELSKKGYAVTVFEQLDTPGGRLRSEDLNGWTLDVGFQVLLTEYPYLKKHLTLDNLQLRHLDAAATIFREGKTSAVGDPFRTKNILWSTVFSDVGTFRDKWLIFKLKRFVGRKSIDALFAYENSSTLKFLHRFGFSDHIIAQFFQPFFGGIFLERDLTTSARMFLFVFKLFASGGAAIPREGIGAVGKEMMAQLPDVTFHFQTTITAIEGQSVRTATGKNHEFDYLINTIPNYGKRSSNSAWQGCYCLYFEHPAPRKIDTPRIGLNASPNRLVNNIFYPSSIQENKLNSGTELLSVTVVDGAGKDENSLIQEVTKELAMDFGLTELTCIKVYAIPFALPINHPPKNTVEFPTGTKTFEAGDFLLNGSQNAACKVGEAVAQCIARS